MFLFFQSLRTSIDSHNFLESGSTTTSASSFKTLGCMTSGPTDLYIISLIRCPWTWYLLTVGGILLPQSPHEGLRSERHEKSDCQWRHRQRSTENLLRSCWVLEPSPSPLLPFLPSYLSWRYTLLHLSSLGNIPVEFLFLIFHILTGFNSICALPFLISSLCVQMAFLYSSQATLLLFCLCISILSLSSTSKSLLSHVGFLSLLLDFLCWRIESSCALREVALKSCQLCSGPLFRRTVCQEISSNNSLHSLKFSDPTLLFCQVHITWDHKLKQRMDVTTQTALMSTSKASLLVVPSNTWTRKSSSADSRSLLDCFQPAMLLSRYPDVRNPPPKWGPVSTILLVTEARMPHE